MMRRLIDDVRMVLVACVAGVAFGVGGGMAEYISYDVLLWCDSGAGDVMTDDDVMHAAGDEVVIDGVRCTVGTDMYYLMMTGHDM